LAQGLSIYFNYSFNYRSVTTRLQYVTFARRRWTAEKNTMSLYELKDYI